MGHNDELNGILNEKRQKEAEKMAAKICDTEVRLQDFEKLKAERNTEKSEKWNKKLQTMLEKNSMIKIEKEMKGQGFLLGMAQRFERMAKQQNEDSTLRLVRCEEKN